MSCLVEKKRTLKFRTLALLNRFSKVDPWSRDRGFDPNLNPVFSLLPGEPTVLTCGSALIEKKTGGEKGKVLAAMTGVTRTKTGTRSAA